VIFSSVAFPAFSSPWLDSLSSNFRQCRVFKLPPTQRQKISHICLWTVAATRSRSIRLGDMSFDTSHPFTRAEALAAKLTDVELGSRRFQRLFHGLYVRAGSKIGVYEMTSAALHICLPGSYASHKTAAWPPA
jgi:hypothetical protein